MLRAALKKYQGEEKGTINVTEILEKPLSERKAGIVERYLLALIIQSGYLPDGLDEKIFEQSQMREIFQKVRALKEKEGRLKIKILAKTIPEPLLEAFDELLLLEIDEETLVDNQRTEKEISYCAKRLKGLNLRTKLRELSLAIKQAESVDNKGKIASLSQEFRDLSKTLFRLEEK